MQLVENVMTTVVSQTGVDLNAVATSTWQQSMLQFVPGCVQLCQLSRGCRAPQRAC